jgi:small subunit ribosomal protein S6
MRRYETIFIIRPNVAEDEIEAITSKATSIIEGDGGTILRINNWGLKKLAYLIKKENQGYYVYADYAGVPVSVAEIERIFRIDDRVLKYLTVKLSDSCDPEAVMEQLASAEPEPISDEEDTEEVKAEKEEEKEEVKEEAKEEVKEEEKEDAETVEDEKAD